VRVRFWGTRGSLPVALTAAQVREKLVAALVEAGGRAFESAEAADRFLAAELPFHLHGTFGGHTACMQVDLGVADPYLLCDLGTGVRPFGQAALEERGGAPASYHVLLSHLHWDHIMGFPFFAPAYVPGNRVRIYGCHEGIEAALRRQQEQPSFPVPLSVLKAELEFVRLEPDVATEIAGCRVTAMRQRHGGDSYAYRIERGGRALVYATDAEHKVEDAADAERFVAFFREADLVVFDSMYSLADAMSVKEDWGHSSNVVGVELCQRARARRLCLFHHEPVADDAQLTRLLQETRRFEQITRNGHAVEVLAAHDGLVVDL
jgi:phosphoribosyl 1,2-cyclic phosphodiesterase